MGGKWWVVFRRSDLTIRREWRHKRAILDPWFAFYYNAYQIEDAERKLKEARSKYPDVEFFLLPAGSRDWASG